MIVDRSRAKSKGTDDLGLETRLDPQLRELIELVLSEIPAIADPTPADRRALAEIVSPLFRGPGSADISFPVARREATAVSEDGFPVRVWIYEPTHQAPSSTLLYIHGGGWVAGSLESYDIDVRRLATQTGMSVVAVDYRLAPEARRPSAIEDCVAAARLVLDSATLPPLLALAGDSAGGNLALEVAIRLKNTGTMLAGLLLFYPVVDPGALNNRSYNENGNDFLLTREDMAYYWNAYLHDGPESFIAQAPFAPEHLRGLPPTVLLTAGFDPLRDEGRELAASLIGSDVPLTYLPNPTLTHGFQQMVPRVDAATTAIGTAYRELRQLIERFTGEPL